MAPVGLNGSSGLKSVGPVGSCNQTSASMVKTPFPRRHRPGQRPLVEENSAVWAHCDALGSKTVGLRAARQVRPGFPWGPARPKILTRPSAAVALIFNDNVTEKRSAREKSREHHYDQVPELGRSDFDRH